MHNIHYFIKDAENTGFENSYFDIIFTRLSFHHLKHPGKVIKELKRIIKGNSKIVIADLLSSDNPDISDLHNAIEEIRDPSHTSMLSEKIFDKVIKDSTLKIIKKKNGIMKNFALHNLDCGINLKYEHKNCASDMNG